MSVETLSAETQQLKFEKKPVEKVAVTMECTLFISRIMMIISESKQLYLEKVRCRLRKHHPFCLLLLGKLMSMRIYRGF